MKFLLLSCEKRRRLVMLARLLDGQEKRFGLSKASSGIRKIEALSLCISKIEISRRSELTNIDVIVDVFNGADDNGK